MSWGRGALEKTLKTKERANFLGHHGGPDICPNEETQKRAAREKSEGALLPPNPTRDQTARFGDARGRADCGNRKVLVQRKRGVRLATGRTFP